MQALRSVLAGALPHTYVSRRVRIRSLPVQSGASAIRAYIAVHAHSEGDVIVLACFRALSWRVRRAAILDAHTTPRSRFFATIDCLSPLSGRVLSSRQSCSGLARAPVRASREGTRSLRVCAMAERPVVNAGAGEPPMTKPCAPNHLRRDFPALAKHPGHHDSFLANHTVLTLVACSYTHLRDWPPLMTRRISQVVLSGASLQLAAMHL